MAKGVNIPLTISGLKQAKEDLKELNKQFDKVKDDPIESAKVAKEFNQLSNAIDETTNSLVEMNKAGKLVGTRFDDLNEVLFETNEEVLPLTSQIGEMEDRMYQLAAAGQAGSAEFKALQKEVVKNRKVIRDTDRQIDLLAENKGFSIFASGIGEVGDSLLRLDFESAAQSAEGLSGSMGNMKKMGGSAIKSLIKTVGMLGSAFVKFGLILLTNPIFLIIAAVTTIVVLLIKFRDKIWFVKKAFELLGKAIQWIIDIFKAMWLVLRMIFDQEGLQAEARAKQAEQYRKDLIKNQQAASEELDQKIRLWKIEGKNVDQLEIQKQKAIIKTSLEVVKALQAEMRARIKAGTITKEQAQALLDEAKKQNAAQKQAIKDLEAAELQAQVNTKNKEKEILKERAANHKEFQKERLDAARLIQDLELELMEDGLRKEREKNQLAYERLIEDTKASETLNQEEKDKIIENYIKLRNQKDLDLRMKGEEAQHIATKEALKSNTIDILGIWKNVEEERTRITKEELAKRLAASKEYADKSMDSLNAINGLANQLAENRLKGVKAGSKEEEKIRLAMFRRQKALSLAQATIDGFKAITASLAQAPIAIGAVPNPAGIASLAFAATTTAAQIAAIAAQQFSGGGGSTPSASSPSGVGGGGATSTEGTSPSFELFGDPNQFNNVESAESQETNLTVQAVVSETEITSTQNKISNIQKNAEL